MNVTYVNTPGWYTQEYVNRRSKKASLAGNTVRLCFYYRDSWTRYTRSRWYEMFMRHMGRWPGEEASTIQTVMIPTYQDLPGYRKVD